MEHIVLEGWQAKAFLFIAIYGCVSLAFSIIAMLVAAAAKIGEKRHEGNE